MYFSIAPTIQTNICIIEGYVSFLIKKNPRKKTSVETSATFQDIIKKMVNSVRIIGAIFALVVSNVSGLSLATPSSRACGKQSTTSTFGREAFVMASRTDERSVVAGGPALLGRPVIEKKQEEEIVEKKRNLRESGWEVRIFNDGINTREHVATSLVEIASLSEVAAYQTMMQAHKNGVAVIGRWVYERAEMYIDALKQNGLVCDMVPVPEDQI